MLLAMIHLRPELVPLFNSSPAVPARMASSFSSFPPLDFVTKCDLVRVGDKRCRALDVMSLHFYMYAS
ncbi:uncharacterized protein ACLA_009370 [Aspergillus clavatus NRRL 1]|uniref:Uncharacterized protein n=1 Tax=Aspergillus clavatus (strain ATCC 1007 / CBS 513.65 / DSM 816 / NCTC 3887 / NRRL 1 / QM 1276 / 107) TaxID=344612 RepID=A1C9U6_ASPCL|nr:uncharacterized protein ACLA_009370 [Aspergillus clavatus NRRL 1]EAW12514.1 hypothetical protein ACLA_009370 [Aspergillus clavatus NRRL 1]